VCDCVILGVLDTKLAAEWSVMVCESPVGLVYQGFDLGTDVISGFSRTAICYQLRG
jgi:hypothetical protein